MKFYSGGEKIGHQDEVSGGEKNANRTTYVTRMFLEVISCSRANKRKQKQINEQKSVPHLQSFVFFLLIRTMDFFCSSRYRRRLALHDFIFCLSRL